MKRSLQLVHPTRVDEPLAAYLETARGAFSRNTERALKSDVQMFTGWCREQSRTGFPASAATVAAFVDEMGRIKTPATVRRYVSSIATVHKGLGRNQPARQHDRAVRTATDAPPARAPAGAGPRSDLAAAQPADRSDRRPAENAGLIVWPRRGTMPSLKRYLAANDGKRVTDVFDDIPPVNAKAAERTGYPTQKPRALLDRIIQASTNRGDVVLDPFCGCATACVSAESLGRQWIGIDLSPVAATLVESRLRDQFGIFAEVHHRTDIPRRTDLGNLPNYRTHKHTLFGQQEGHCGGCRMMFPFRNFEIDHVIPRARGGFENIENLQLLCGACNRAKGTGTQAELIAKLKEGGQLALPCTRIQGWTNQLPPCSVTAWSTRTRYYRRFVRRSRKLASSGLCRRSR